jgi:hypothetical protein
MIKQDKILKEAKVVEIQFKKLKAVIFEMCAELEEEKNPEKKEIILQAVKILMVDLDVLREKHEDKMKEL